MLDVGCGPGELVIRIAERHGCAGVGIDAAPNQIMAAVERAARRAPTAELRFEIAEAERGQFEPESFALAACLGSSHALGGTRETLEELREVVRPGGHVLLADGFWEREPGPEYLEALGATRDELGDFGELLRTAQGAGLDPVYCHVASREQWDRYEWRLILNAQRHLDGHPDSPLAGALRQRVDAARARLAAPGGRTRWASPRCCCDDRPANLSVRRHRYMASCLRANGAGRVHALERVPNSGKAAQPADTPA